MNVNLIKFSSPIVKKIIFGAETNKYTNYPTITFGLKNFMCNQSIDRQKIAIINEN